MLKVQEFDGVNAQRICAGLGIQPARPGIPLAAKYQEFEDAYSIEGVSPEHSVLMALFENGNLEITERNLPKLTRVTFVLWPDGTLVSHLNGLHDPLGSPSRPHELIDPRKRIRLMRQTSDKVFGAVREFLQLRT